jgi:C4-dicarboxylate-specific signal transduction histidine kinase
MAEVASEVLHDVGNALQAVTTSAGLLRQKLSSQATDDLGRIGGMLAEHAHDLQQWLSCDPKGQQVPRYLSMLADNLVAERDVIKEEVVQLAHGIHHIENLVRQQNEHTHRKGVVEAVDVTVLIAEAVRLSSIEEQGVVVVTQVAAAVIRTQKHRLLAVLINLLKNAAHSVLQVAEERQAIRIEATVANDLLSIRVADDGVGIAAENLDRIFETGFSSKPNSCGRGLHSSANSVRELGGKLRVESDGEDRGACFLVELPMHQAGVTAGG